MNAALYEFDAEDMEDAIEAGKPFSVYWKEVQEYVRELDLEEEEEYDEATLREMFETVAGEMEMKRKHRSGILYSDVGYRLPLSVALKKMVNEYLDYFRGKTQNNTLNSLWYGNSVHLKKRRVTWP